jgi:hypothetical protein
VPALGTDTDHTVRAFWVGVNSTSGAGAFTGFLPENHDSTEQPDNKTTALTQAYLETYLKTGRIFIVSFIAFDSK